MAKPTLKNFNGTNLKEMRRKRCISQIQAARAIGTHINTFALWERGGGLPSLEHFEKLKVVFGLDMPNKNKKQKLERRIKVLDFLELQADDKKKMIKKIKEGI